jgi:hypothetical protein
MTGDNVNKEVLGVMLSTMRRGFAAACACAGLMAGVGASTAGATPYYYWPSGQYAIANGQPWLTGPPQYLVQNAGWLDGWACVNAINYYGGTLAGTGACGNWAGPITVTHPYDGATLRDGAITPYGSGVGYAYQAWETY